MNNFKRNLSTKLIAVIVVATGLIQAACSDLWSEQHPETYYINSGETIADWLTNRSEEYSDFIYCLNHGKENLWGEMRTYGGHTCFAPNNAAFEEYLKELFGEPGHTVEELTVGQCDTIAKTHLCNSTFFCKDLNDGAFPYPNLLDRYLTYNIDSALNADGSYRVVYKVNKLSEITLRDDTVQNGVVQKVSKIINPSNDFLPDIMVKDTTISMFYEALLLTKIADTLSTYYMDETYKEPEYDSTLLCFQTTGKTAVIYKTSYETETAIWPTHRYFKFTAFIPQNSVFRANGINSIEEMKTYAHNIYGDTILTDENGSPIMKNGVPMSTFDSLAHPHNSLNKFLLYHILPEELAYNRMNMVYDKITNNYRGWKNQDVEDFYETMLPHSIIRISTPFVDKKRYINRKGISGSNLIPGIQVIDPKEVDATSMNGVYYYLTDILKYDDFTRNQVMNTRMRYMCNNMSPDFVNSGASGRYGGQGESAATDDRYVVGFRTGYTKNFICSEQSEFYVRYADSGFGCYMGYEMTIRGMYDIMVKLPPVPFDGTYEVRMFMNTMASAGSVGGRGVVQIYFREGNNPDDWDPCGIPVDLRIAGDDARIGNVKDSELKQNVSEAEGLRRITANEKAMHNRGYMKAPSSYSDGASTTNNLRDNLDCLRKILTTEFMKSNQDYWIRLRLVLDDPTAVCPFNFIELVPKSIYAGDTPEDSY